MKEKYSDIIRLERELDYWKNLSKNLQREVEFLRTHSTISQGIRGETLICELTGGTMTKYAERYDVLMPSKIKVEVKFSKLNIPVSQSVTRRWNWGKPLGQDGKKEYDFLILLGEKDKRFPNQYLDETPYVCFLLPMSIVDSVMVKGCLGGGMIQISSNLMSGRSPKSRILQPYMIAMEDIEELLDHAVERKSTAD